MDNQFLIEELDGSIDDDAEQLWIEEARSRYEAYLKGELEALPGDDVMNRARNALSGAIADRQGARTLSCSKSSVY